MARRRRLVDLDVDIAVEDDLAGIEHFVERGRPRDHLLVDVVERGDIENLGPWPRWIVDILREEEASRW